MSLHYDRQQFTTRVIDPSPEMLGSVPDEAGMEEAAEALRQVELEATLLDVPDISSLDETQLEHMTIDELRAVANALDVPDRAQITEQDELIEAIRRRI